MGEPAQMPSWTPPGSDSPLQEEKRVLYKHEATIKQHSVLALITRKGAAERLVDLENSNLRISFESFETFRLKNKIYGFVQYQVVTNVVERFATIK